jgi:hypothetical protein
MKKLGAFFALFLFIPFGLSAAVVIPILLGVAAAGTIGYTIYRSLNPIDISSSLEFFSSCWTCDTISIIIKTLSDNVPNIYESIGLTLIPIAVGMTIIWFTWQILRDFITAEGNFEPMKFGYGFAVHLVRLGLVCALFLFPLPSFISSTFVTPIMNVGLSVNNVIQQKVTPEANSLETCLLSLALKENGETGGIFPANLRHNVTCNIAQFHQLTGLGMSVGWSYMHMAFGRWIPNPVLLVVGFAILLMFFWALLPVPFYFLEMFVRLTFNLIMLPLMLLSWLFKDWEMVKISGSGVKEIIEDVAKSTLGIAIV